MPDAEEDAQGTEVGDASGIQVPSTTPVSGKPNAVLFIPDGVVPAEGLKVRVVKLKSKGIGAVIQRRC